MFCSALLSYELIDEATEVGGGPWAVVLGIFAGAAAFTFGDMLIGRFQRRRQGNVMPNAEEGAGLSILLGALLDGVPETAVLGLTLLQTNEIGVAMLVAVFISNLPEGIAATTTLIEGGWKRSLVLEIWGAVVLACGLAAAAGYRAPRRRVDRRHLVRLRLLRWGGAHDARHLDDAGGI